MHPKIDKYIQTVLSAGLMTQAQLERCNRRVSRAARDIPPSDPAWVGALQAEGLLNHFQAEWLLERSGPGLVLGDCILLERIAEGTVDHEKQFGPLFKGDRANLPGRDRTVAQGHQG